MHLVHVSFRYTGADAVSILSEMVSECNVRERFDTKEETWPLDQPRNFIPLHYHGKYITKETTEIANKNIELVSTLGLLVELVIILSLILFVSRAAFEAD